MLSCGLPLALRFESSRFIAAPSRMASPVQCDQRIINKSEWSTLPTRSGNLPISESRSRIDRRRRCSSQRRRVHLVRSRGGAASDWAEEESFCGEEHRQCRSDPTDAWPVGEAPTTKSFPGQTMPAKDQGGLLVQNPCWLTSSYPRQRPYSLRCMPGTAAHRAWRSCYVPHRLRTGSSSC